MLFSLLIADLHCVQLASVADQAGDLHQSPLELLDAWRELTRDGGARLAYLCLLAFADADPPVAAAQKSSTCLAPVLVALREAFAASRLSAAAAWPRAIVAPRLAPLIHRLRNGFFFSHGFFMVQPPTFRLTDRTPDLAIIATRPINSAPVPAAMRIALMGSSLV